VITEGKDVWDIARVCKNPFGMRERCGVLEDGERHIYETRAEKRRAFTAHNLITAPTAEREAVARQEKRRASDDIMVRIGQALRKTRNDSAPGPDGVSWKLLKAIKETK